MHDIDWSNLRYVLAMAREGSFGAAGRSLGVDATTMARRLRAMEQALGARLFERGADGAMHLTPAGEVVAQRAQAVEIEIGSLAEAVARTHGAVTGVVRVTAVPILVNRVLLPAVGDLMAQHPDLRVELVADARNLSLTRRDADIAMRLARPGEDAGSGMIAKRIGTAAYAAYAATKAIGTGTDLPWVTYDDAMAHLPQARWLAIQAARSATSPVAVNDAETLMQAVLSGLGRSLLPCIVADQVPELARVAAGEPAFPAREIWLLTHPDLRPLGRIAAVMTWLENTISQLERACNARPAR